VYREFAAEGVNQATYHLMLARIASSGAYDTIDVFDWLDWDEDYANIESATITNADQGVLLSWVDHEASGGTFGSGAWVSHMATTTGTGVSMAMGPNAPCQDSLIAFVSPVLQTQDGSFVGECSGGMVAFDASGNVRWVVPNETPQIATDDGGVIGQSGITYDPNGNATGRVGSLPAQSWTMNEYQTGPIEQVVFGPVLFAPSFWPFEGGNPSGNSTAPFPVDSVTNAWVAGLGGPPIEGGNAPVGPSSSSPTGPPPIAHVWNSNSEVSSALDATRWRNFAGSNCAKVFGNPTYGIASNVAYYSLTRAQTKQNRMTNYYDLGNPGVAGLTISAVTDNELHDGRSLAAYLGNATAATVNMGENKHTAVLLKAGFFSLHPERFTLMHETLLHAYGNWSDAAIFGNPFFTNPPNNLWQDQSKTHTISTWIGTDCHCTPENPANAPNSCPANTAASIW
jgi:hypothetical protein